MLPSTRELDSRKSYRDDFWSRKSSAKRALGLPRPPRKVPQTSPRAPRAPLERPRDASGGPPELARSTQRVQQGTGDLKTAPWDLKKLTPEASGTSFWSLRGLFVDIL